ncbi:hypothetical protein D3C85_1428910 [compost metagenome]
MIEQHRQLFDHPLHPSTIAPAQVQPDQQRRKQHQPDACSPPQDPATQQRCQQADRQPYQQPVIAPLDTGTLQQAVQPVAATGRQRRGLLNLAKTLQDPLLTRLAHAAVEQAHRYPQQGQADQAKYCGNHGCSSE